MELAAVCFLRVAEVGHRPCDTVTGHRPLATVIGHRLHACFLVKAEDAFAMPCSDNGGLYLLPYNVLASNVSHVARSWEKK